MEKFKNLTIENARIIFRNFAGEAGQFNAEGDRNFCVLIDHEDAEAMAADGWNIRMLKPKEEGDDPQPYLQVKVSYKNIPPKIVLIAGNGKKTLNEDTVNILDWAEIESVDLIVRPYHWNVTGKSGIKGYVKAMYVTIVQDEFESKYYDVPDSAASAITEEQ